MNSSIPLSKGLEAEEIISIFNAQFSEDYFTCLRGGAAEPLYEPASGDTPAHIFFREDYASSALHEVAHWCIAGSARRQQLDYGYWYNPDGRSADAQAKFLQAEARPQALEWCFARAAGVTFRLSLDNLDAPSDPEAGTAFAAAVLREARALSNDGLPPRAQRFFDALRACSGTSTDAQALQFAEADLE
ncbi:elongation factor P hydroxylase [Congregibacter sp.]|uniref:elongation factor P hydroxylase n=1 Tax=Congregibacter sp. TaxID=2744308 RepID=UPI003F6D3B78